MVANARIIRHFVDCFILEGLLHFNGLEKTKETLEIALEAKTNAVFREFLTNRGDSELDTFDPKFKEWKVIVSQDLNQVITNARVHIAFYEALRLIPLLSHTLGSAAVTQFFGPVPITVTVLTPFFVKGFLAVESWLFPNSPVMTTIDKIVGIIKPYLFYLALSADYVSHITKPFDLISKNISMLIFSTVEVCKDRFFNIRESYYGAFFLNMIVINIFGKNLICTLHPLFVLSKNLNDYQVKLNTLLPYVDEIFQQKQGEFKYLAHTIIKNLITETKIKMMNSSQIILDRKWMFDQLNEIENLHQDVISQTHEDEQLQQKIQRVTNLLKNLILEVPQHGSFVREKWIIKYVFEKIEEFPAYMDAVDENNEYILPRLEQQT
ncbi:MAG: hypothetical protein Tsb0021_11140 [Chlamydiales bacterium]